METINPSIESCASLGPVLKALAEACCAALMQNSQELGGTVQTEATKTVVSVWIKAN
jgi:hypothetical protein